MSESYISELGDSLSHGVANTNGDRVKIIAPKLYNDGNGNHPSIATALSGKADTTHTHITSIASDSSAGTVVTLAHDTQYKLTAGGTSVLFKTPTDNNSNTIPSAYCETAAGTAAKTALCTNYTATPNTYLHVLIRYANTSAGALTLNVNGQGAKPVYINGALSSSSNYTLPAGTYIAFYDGTNYCLRTDGKIEANITGSSGFADAVYNRSAMSGDGWFKIAESSLIPRTNSDIIAVWDVTFASAGAGIYYEKLCLDVRYNSSGNGALSRFIRTYEADKTASLKFAVRISGTGGSGNTQLQLWVWLENAYCSVGIRQVSGSNWSLHTYNKAWTYYSSTTGGTTKPVADETNHILVSDSSNVHMRDASFISSGTLPVARGGTGIASSTNVNAVVIGNSTTATNAMQTVRTGNGAFYATAQDAKPQFGTLPVAQGGTGKTSAKDACNAFINALDTGSSTPVDADYYISQYVSGGTTTTTFHRRPVSALWAYIKGKLTSVSGVNISGNAATATSATNVALTGSVKTTSTTNGDTIQFQAGSGTAGTVTIVNAKHAASADSATTATNANITRTADTTNGDKLQIGTGTAVNITNAKHAASADSATSASKVANKLTLKVKTGTTEGTDLYTYDGSGAKTLDIKQGANITLTAAAGSLTIAGTPDTKNTAGSTDTSSKIFLIGATSQAANPQTYSQDTTYVDTDGALASTKVRVAEKCTLQFNTTTNALDFVFA